MEEVERSYSWVFFVKTPRIEKAEKAVWAAWCIKRYRRETVGREKETLLFTELLYGGSAVKYVDLKLYGADKFRDERAKHTSKDEELKKS